MRLKVGIALVALFGIGAVAGWYGALSALPSLITDMTFRTMLGRGARVNALREARVRYAPNDVVPLDNADTVTRSTIYDLSDGPLLYEGVVPQGLEYWSVSIFARNSDTLFVANDRTIPPGRFRLVVRLADQRSAVPANAQVVSTSRRGFLLIRAVMMDRSDKADIARTLAAVADARVTALPGNPKSIQSRRVSF